MMISTWGRYALRILIDLAEHPLEPGDNRIRFTPDAAGTIPYTCWMGMIRSAIYVTEELT